MELTAGPAVPEEEILHTDEEDEEEGRDEDEDAAGRASRRRKRVYEAPTLSAYERERLSNIERIKAVLAELGLVGGLLGVSKKGAQPMPKRQELLANLAHLESACQEEAVQEARHAQLLEQFHHVARGGDGEPSR